MAFLPGKRALHLSLLAVEVGSFSATKDPAACFRPPTCGICESRRKGSHRNFEHAESGSNVTISGQLGADAEMYQEKDVKEAIEKSKSYEIQNRHL